MKLQSILDLLYAQFYLLISITSTNKNLKFYQYFMIFATLYILLLKVLNRLRFIIPKYKITILFKLVSQKMRCACIIWINLGFKQYFFIFIKQIRFQQQIEF